MKRAIVAPAILAGAALDELKGWLAITTSREDAPLTACLRASLEMCESFIGQMPLEALCEELIAPSGCWQKLATRPVQAVTGIEAMPAQGVRLALLPEHYAIDLDADGRAHVRLLRPDAAGRYAVRFTAGLASEWAALPEALRHGVIRLAAHYHRQRDSEGPEPSPPAAVAALWRPWRGLRLT